MKPLIDWIDHRTGIRSLTKDVLFENIPGGSRWRYVWGSTLTFALFVQFVTGVFLWMGYSASSGDAWESVNYIQNEMTGGWLLRGIHHWMAQAMPMAPSSTTACPRLEHPTPGRLLRARRTRPISTTRAASTTRP